MAIKPGVGEQHTFRVSGIVGAMPFATEMNGTLEDARSKASDFEKRQDSDGMFARGRARIEKWDGNRYVEVERYKSRDRY